jgi:hypothetical protein
VEHSRNKTELDDRQLLVVSPMMRFRPTCPDDMKYFSDGITVRFLFPPICKLDWPSRCWLIKQTTYVISALTFFVEAAELKPNIDETYSLAKHDFGVVQTLVHCGGDVKLSAALKLWASRSRKTFIS